MSALLRRKPEVVTLISKDVVVPRAQSPLAWLSLLALVAAAAVIFGALAPDYYLSIGDLALIAAVGAIGLNLLTGYAGQLSVGNAALLAIGAFTAVGVGSHAGLLVAVLAGGMSGAVVGILVGFPSLRLRGLYLVLSTLALQFVVAFAFEQYQTSTNAVAGYELPTGNVGPLLLGSDRAWWWLLLVVCALAVLVASSLGRGRPGRAWRALKGQEVAAAVMGINVTAQKLVAFAVSSFFVGAAGALGAFYARHVSYETFTLDLAVSYVAMIIIGGLGSVSGSVAGAVVVTALPFAISRAGGAWFSGTTGQLIQQNLSAVEGGVYGLIVIAFLLFEPRGLAALAQRARAALASRLPGSKA